MGCSIGVCQTILGQVQRRGKGALAVRIPKMRKISTTVAAVKIKIKKKTDKTTKNSKEKKAPSPIASPKSSNGLVRQKAKSSSSEVGGTTPPTPHAPGHTSPPSP